jgi:transposase-like protein
MVAEVRPDYPSDWPAIVAVAQRLGIGSAETLRKWVRQAEAMEVGRVPQPTTNPPADAAAPPTDRPIPVPADMMSGGNRRGTSRHLTR